MGISSVKCSFFPRLIDLMLNIFYSESQKPLHSTFDRYIIWRLKLYYLESLKLFTDVKEV